MEELGERNLYPQFEKGTKQLISELENLPYRDTFFYQNIFELNYNYSNHQETNRQKLNGQLLKNATEHLDYFYLLQKQQLEFAIKSHEKLFKEKINLSSLKRVETKLQKEPVFKIYELTNIAISKLDNDELYFEIEALLKKEIEKLGRIDKIVILKILFNYSISQINKGKKEYFNKIFSLYKFGLNQNLLLEKKQISDSTFTNIITTGVNVKEFDWVETFIEEYKKRLPHSVRADASSFGLGLLFFHKKEFSKTIDLILNHTFSKPLQILQSKTILLRAYFEQYIIENSYYDLLISQTQAFEKFIRRNDLISEPKKERYLNFALFTRKIISSHWQNTIDQSIVHNLNSNEVLLKFWLLEKINELEL